MTTSNRIGLAAGGKGPAAFDWPCIPPDRSRCNAGFHHGLLVLLLLAAGLAPLAAQDGGWTHWGANAGSQRYTPHAQIDTANFDSLETAWVWRGDNFGPGVDYILRATPIYAEGKLFSVAGQRRTVVALDPASGLPLDGFGDGGTVDLTADFGYPYHPEDGLPSEVDYITNSSPPIVVNGVVVVGNSHEQGYRQTRRENDAWQWTGHVSAWAPLSADPELNLVYIVTDPPTNDSWGGFHPGQNLFATSIIALDVRTGERVWHFQTVHHDIWNYDNPTAPTLADVTVDGRRIPVLVQTTKQAFAYVLNRETGEPVGPIEERAVPRGHVPGEYYSPTQPFPTRPAAYEMQGISPDDLMDFTPELRRRALEQLEQYEYGPLFTPPLHRDNDRGKRATLFCPGYGDDPNPIGKTVMKFVSMTGGGVPRVDGLPIVKPPYGRITAIDRERSSRSRCRTSTSPA